MENAQMEIKILLPRNDYTIERISNLLEFDETDYRILSCFDVELSTRYEPSCIGPGEIFVSLGALISVIKDDPLFLNIFSAIIYDFVKFMLSKLPYIKSNSKYDYENIGINIFGNFNDEIKNSISFTVTCNSNNIEEIMLKLSNINELIKDENLGNVDLTYNDENGEWNVSNK